MERRARREAARARRAHARAGDDALVNAFKEKARLAEEEADVEARLARLRDRKEERRAQKEEDARNAAREAADEALGAGERFAAEKQAALRDTMGAMGDSVSQTLEGGVDPLAALEALGERNLTEEQREEFALVRAAAAAQRTTRPPTPGAGAGRAGGLGERELGEIAAKIEKEIAKEAKKGKGYRRRKPLPQGNPVFRGAPADRESGWKGLHRGLPWARWLEAAVLVRTY